MLRSPLLCLSEVPKSFKQVKFRNIFGLSNVIHAVIDFWGGKSVCFGYRVYFTVVRLMRNFPSGVGTRIQGELHLL